MVKNIDEISIENLSHFVKTPLAIITGYCDIINDGIIGEISPEQKEYINKIKDEVTKVDEFLNNFIDKVEKSFKEELEKKIKMDLIKTLKDIFLIIYSQAEKSNIFPDFILPEQKIIIDVNEQFDKALMLVIREYIKSMKKKQFFKLKVRNDQNIIEIWADKDEFYNDISSIESNFLYITGKTMLETVGFKLNISNGRLFLKYG